MMECYADTNSHTFGNYFMTAKNVYDMIQMEKTDYKIQCSNFLK